MIKIKRGNCPSILKRSTLLASYYNHHLVTDALNRMQFGKCAYCETMIHDSPHIDHYNPKEEYILSVTGTGQKIYNWNQANQWNNLLYTCSKCNGAKKDRPFENGVRVILNPRYLRIDPEDHIDFHIIDKNTVNIKVIVTAKNGSALGDNTVKKMKLHIRKDHLGALIISAQVFENLFLRLLLHLKVHRDIFQLDCQEKISEINRSMLSNSPYAGFARAFFRKRLEEFDQNERRILENELGRKIDLMITIPTGLKYI